MGLLLPELGPTVMGPHSQYLCSPPPLSPGLSILCQIQPQGEGRQLSALLAPATF